MSETPTTELVPTAPRSAALEVANRLGVKMQTMLDTVKVQCFRGGANVSDSQIAAFISVCWEIGANPLIPGQIYAYPTQGGGIIPMIGPDFVLTKLGTHPDIESWETTVYPIEGGMPTHATCKIWRKGREHPLTYTAWLSEWKVVSNPNWNHRVRHMLWLRTTKQAARQVINGLPMDEDERHIMQAQVIEEEQPRLAADSAPSDNPTSTRRRGRPPGSGIAGATAGQGPQGNGQVQQAPVIETPSPAPEEQPEATQAPTEEVETVTPVTPPKRTTIGKGEQIKGLIKILKIEKSMMPAKTGENGAVITPAFALLALECEGEYYGMVYSKIIDGVEGMEGKSINIIASARLIGGGKYAPFITDVLPAE